MAPAELSIGVRIAGSRASVGAAILHTYVALWAATLLAAALTSLFAPGSARALLSLRLSPALTPAPSLARMLALAGHNLPIAVWPTLLPLLVRGSGRRAHRGADAIVIACVLVNVIPVGAALGGYGGALLPFTPQLPLEWGALSVGYGSWLYTRNGPRDASASWRLRGVVLALTLAAAAVETFAVPHN
jgi:hypothetical protein